jgi:uncharacterized OB-fold protein
MSEYRKPLPVEDDLSRPYWQGARRGVLLIQRCTACGSYVHYPKPTCPGCGHADLRPTPVSGRGTVYTFTVSHYVGAPGFENETPYVIALVELEEQPGLRLVSNLRGCGADQVRVGMPVEVVFEEVMPGITLPQFRPRAA